MRFEYVHQITGSAFRPQETLTAHADFTCPPGQFDRQWPAHVATLRCRRHHRRQHGQQGIRRTRLVPHLTQRRNRRRQYRCQGPLRGCTELGCRSLLEPRVTDARHVQEGRIPGDPRFLRCRFHARVEPRPEHPLVLRVRQPRRFGVRHGAQRHPAARSDVHGISQIRGARFTGAGQADRRRHQVRSQCDTRNPVRLHDAAAPGHPRPVARAVHTATVHRRTS